MVIQFSSPTTGLPIHFTPGGSGSPVLFVHGQLFDHSIWAPILEAFAGRRPVASFDMPSHGRAPVPLEPSIVGMGNAILEVLDTLGWRRALAVGHSLGATAILHATRIAPHRFEAAAYLGLPPAHLLPEAKAQFQAMAAAIENGFPPNIEASLVPLWYSPAYRASHPDLANRVRKVLENNEPAAAAGIMRALAIMPSLLPLPEGYDVPSLVIAMDEDHATPFPLSEPLATALRAEIAHLPGGHIPFDECPETLLAVIEEFLGGRP